MQHVVKARHRSQIQAFVSQAWHDLRRWRALIFKAITHRHDLSLFLVCQRMINATTSTPTLIAKIINASLPTPQGSAGNSEHMTRLVLASTGATASSIRVTAICFISKGISLPL
jgi:hypothetical protein